MILALDLGSTSWKAGLFARSRLPLAISALPAPAIRQGRRTFYPANSVMTCLKTLVCRLPENLRRQIKGVALTGMAEAGLLIDRNSGKPQSDISPWFDPLGQRTFERLSVDSEFANRPITGLPNSSKYSIYKLLALRDEGKLLNSSQWLGLVEYSAFELTGCITAERTLAARTYAYDILENRWDTAFLKLLKLPVDVFPPIVNSGSPIGFLKAILPGVPAGIPVCVCGHDHLCAALAADALDTGSIFSSAGTAQVLLRVLEKPYRPCDIRTGLSYGPSLTDGYICIGSVQAAGGSLSWLCRLLYNNEDYAMMLQEASSEQVPSGIRYYPFLNGRGAPCMDTHAEGAFLNLNTNTTRGKLILGVYEGIAMENRVILTGMGGASAKELSIIGGLTLHPRLIEIFANVLNMPIIIPEVSEGTLAGAAMLCAKQLNIPNICCTMSNQQVQMPDSELSAKYDVIFKESYLPGAKAVTRSEIFD